MISRRVFLRNGGLALVSLGFAPTFLARTAAASRRAQEAAHRDLPARRGGRPEHGRALRRARLLPRAADDRDSASRRRRRRRARSRRLLRLPSAAGAARAALHNGTLAVVHACGSPDSTRSHFDAQDYMESATPGVKSTDDGWLNRYAAARERADDASPFRAVALAPQLPRSLQGAAPALAIGQIGQFGIRDGAGGQMLGASFEEQYAAAADTVLNGTGREAFDAVKLLKQADPARYQPANGADYPRERVRPGAEADRAAREGGRRPRDRVRRDRQLGSPRQRGQHQGQLGDAARRLRPRHRGARDATSASAWATPSS